MTRLQVLAIVTLTVSALALLAGGAHAQGLEGPDLAVDEVSTDDPPTPGSSVRIVATIVNEGDSASNEFTTNFTVDGEQLGEFKENGSLSDGGSTTVESSVPWNVEAGQFTLGANVTHEDGGISGSDDNPDNDELEVNYTVGADLVVTGLQVDHEEIVEGEAVEFTATVENVADPDDHAPDADSFKVAFPIDGQSIVAPVPVSDGLAAGESETVTKTWQTSEGDEGSYSVGAVADENEAIDDLDRSNNEADPISLEVREALPDLVVSGLSFTPDPVGPDQTVTFTAKVANNGQTDALPHNVSLVVGDETVDTAAVDGLDQGADENVTLSWTASAGSHDIELHVDSEEAIEETNEGNNAWTLTLAVGPDLVAEDLDIQPPEPRASDRVRFTAQFTNDGLGVDEPFDVSFDVDGTPIDTVEVGSLGPDESRNVTSVAWNATTGDHDVSVVLDPDEAIGEVDRDNNQLSQTLTVGEPRPDIGVLSASLDPAAPQDGDTVTVRAKIENAGARAADAFTVEATIDGEEIGETRVEGLEPDEQTTLDLGEWTASTGAHELEVFADVDEEIEEGSEDDNRFVRQLGIGADLDMLEVSASPSEPEPGEDVTALVLAQNNGSVQAPETAVSFHLDGNRIGTATLDALGPNEQGSAEFTFTAARSGTLEARLDAEDALDEFDEDNNQAQTSIQLASDAQPPDLTVRSVTVDGNPGEGETVRFTAEIANVGNGPSPEALVSFRIDGDPIGSPVSVEGMPSGSSVEVTSAEWSPTENEHELEVTVDSDERVGEADETNNSFTRSVEGSAVGLPLSPAAAVLGLLVAALVIRRAGGRKRKPPKT